MTDKIPFKIATSGRALGFRVNPKKWTIDGLPARGGALAVSVGGGSGGSLLAFGSPGLLAGSLLANAMISRGRLMVEFTAADGRRATRVAPVSRQSSALALGDWLHNLTVSEAV